MKAVARAAGQLPDQIGIDVSKEHFAGFGLPADSRDVLQYPANFQRTEVSRERQAGFSAEEILAKLFRHARHIVGYACVLPDNRVGDGLAGLPVPHHGCFALVGYADGGQIVRPKPRLLHGFRNDLLGALPDFFGIVLHPSRLWEELRVFLLRAGDDPARAIKHDEARAGCALINGADVVGHGSERSSNFRQ